MRTACLLSLLSLALALACCGCVRQEQRKAAAHPPPPRPRAAPEPWEGEVLARVKRARAREAERAWAPEIAALRLVVVPATENTEMTVCPIITQLASPAVGLPPPPVGVPVIGDMISIEAGLNVSWGWDGSGQTGFILERSEDGSDFSTRVGVTDASTTNLTDPDVMGGVPYWYRVAAFNGLEINRGDWSAVAGPIYYTWEP